MALKLPVPAILAIALEIVFILSFEPLVAFFGGILARPSPWNPVLVAGVYLALCVAVVFIRKLGVEGVGGKWSRKQAWLGLPAVCFGFLLLHIAAETGGFYRYIEVTKNPVDSAWVPLSAVGGIALSFVFLFVIVLDIKPTIGPGLRREVIRAACMVVAQLMIVILAAWWQGLGAGSEPDPTIGVGGKALIFTAVYLFFLLFFTSPRLLLLAADCTRVSAACFFLGTGYYVWATLDGTAWP